MWLIDRLTPCRQYLGHETVTSGCHAKGHSLLYGTDYICRFSLIYNLSSTKTVTPPYDWNIWNGRKW